MNPDHDSFQYCIEDTLLLKFLITRYTEMLRTDDPRLDPVWKGLGLAGLYQNKELENAFKTLISSGSYTVAQVLTSSLDLFLAELQRLETAESTDYVPKKIERRPLKPRTTRKFLFWAWSEGRKMRRERDFRFYPVWELVSWLGLNAEEYIKEFEKRCRFSQSSLETRLDDGLEIVKTAIFKRSLDNAIFSEQLVLGRSIAQDRHHTD